MSEFHSVVKRTVKRMSSRLYTPALMDAALAHVLRVSAKSEGGYEAMVQGLLFRELLDDSNAKKYVATMEYCLNPPDKRVDILLHHRGSDEITTIELTHNQVYQSDGYGKIAQEEALLRLSRVPNRYYLHIWTHAGRLTETSAKRTPQYPLCLREPRCAFGSTQRTAAYGELEMVRSLKSAPYEFLYRTHTEAPYQPAAIQIELLLFKGP